MKLKVCGLSNPIEIETCINNDVDFCGFILNYPKSHRFINYEKAEKLFLDERPILPIYWYTRNYLIHNHVKGWDPLILDNHPYKFLDLVAD